MRLRGKVQVVVVACGRVCVVPEPVGGGRCEGGVGHRYAVVRRRYRRRSGARHQASGGAAVCTAVKRHTEPSLARVGVEVGNVDAYLVHRASRRGVGVRHSHSVLLTRGGSATDHGLSHDILGAAGVWRPRRGGRCGGGDCIRRGRLSRGGDVGCGDCRRRGRRGGGSCHRGGGGRLGTRGNRLSCGAEGAVRKGCVDLKARARGRWVARPCGWQRPVAVRSPCSQGS